MDLTDIHHGTIPVYINNFNCLSSVRGLVEYLAEVENCEPIIVDNASTYPPLLEWYASRPCKIIQLAVNTGHVAPWKCGAVMSPSIHRAVFGSDYYVVTDPDLSLESCPKNLLKWLIACKRRFPKSRKIGLGLRIDDLPDAFPFRKEVLRWEAQFWHVRVDATILKAGVDTTFALYDIDMAHEQAFKIDNSYRTDKPYLARHLPWYLTPETITEEDKYRMQRVRSASTQWSSRMRDAFGLAPLPEAFSRLGS